MGKLRLNRIRAALATTRSWPEMHRRLAALTDDELREAGEIERLGRRRQNMLRILRAERDRRAGKLKRMHRLKVEVNG